MIFMRSFHELGPNSRNSKLWLFCILGKLDQEVPAAGSHGEESQ
jgi:hypothetical protein